MFCPECEESNEANSKFCTACGCSLKEFSQKTEDQHRIIHHAGFKKRLLAYFIDNVILLIIVNMKVSIIILILMSLVKMTASNISTIHLKFYLNFALMIFLSWGYFTLMESSFLKATIGKLAVDIVVTDITGKRISFGRANGRYWGKYISALILMIGYIMAGFTEKKQALHDRIANTLVMKK